jgi:Ulp1 family protease
MLNSRGLQALVDVPMEIGPRSQTPIDQIILNKGLWDYSFMVIATGYSAHYAQLLKLQMKCKNKKRQAIVKEEYKIVRSCRE